MVKCLQRINEKPFFIGETTETNVLEYFEIVRDSSTTHCARHLGICLPIQKITRKHKYMPYKYRIIQSL